MLFSSSFVFYFICSFVLYWLYLFSIIVGDGDDLKLLRNKRNEKGEDKEGSQKWERGRIKKQHYEPKGIFS